MIKKQYKKLLKEKRKKWNGDIIEKLQNLESEDPKQYWNLINEMRGIRKNNNINNSHKFEMFYENLFSKHSHNEKLRHDIISIEIEELLKINKHECEKYFTLK